MRGCFSLRRRLEVVGERPRGQRAWQSAGGGPWAGGRKGKSSRVTGREKWGGGTRRKAIKRVREKKEG